MKQPLITIIVPCGPGYPYDVVLDSIKKVDYPLEKIELIIVEGKQPAKQRNEAVKVAKGEIIFFFDDDVILKKNIIKKMLKHYDNKTVMLVGGPNLTPPSDTFIQKCFGYVMSSYFGSARMSNRYKFSGKVRKATEKDLMSCNLNGRAKILKKNFFNETLWPNEENELFNSPIKKGYKLIYDPNAIVYHSRRPTIKKFIKQNFGYGRGRSEQTFLQPSSFELLFMLPTLFSSYLLGIFVLFILTQVNLFNILYLLILSIPLFIYILIDIMTSFLISLRNRSVSTFLVLPFIFPLVHIPYGIGMVYGFLQKLTSSKKYDLNIKLKRIKL